MEHLKSRAEKKEIPEFSFVEINGMKLSNPHEAYTILYRALTGKKTTSHQAATLLEKRFASSSSAASSSSSQKSCVVLMDELDLLVTKKQEVLYSFFDWPNKTNSRLIVIAVANTMDLPERVLMNRVQSRLGLTRITFEPYNHSQLVAIVTNRLQGISGSFHVASLSPLSHRFAHSFLFLCSLSAFNPTALELCARKVSAVSGDARRALEICRRAVEVAEIRHKKDAASSALNVDSPAAVSEDGAAVPALVQMPDVDQALKAMFSASTVVAIRNASLHEKIFMSSIFMEQKRTGSPSCEYGGLCARHVAVCKMHSLDVPNATELASICVRLNISRLILLEGGVPERHQQVRLNVNEDDVAFAMRADVLVSKIMGLN